MERLLVCIDGSRYADSCCRYAAWIASKAEARLEVVYVTDLRQFEIPFVADLSGSLGLQPYQAVMGQLQELEDKKAEVTLSQAEKTIRESGFTGEIKRTHKTGFLVDCLRELEEETDMIVIGKRGENANFASEHLGSTMERVARAASKPCFVASREFKQIERALISYDGSDSCREAIEFVARSPLFKSARLDLVTVSPKEEETERLAILKEAEGILVEAGLTPNCQMLHGEAAPAVIDYVKGNAIDLLVMGAYRHSRIRRLILGSSTTEMLSGCQIPTLLFR